MKGIQICSNHDDHPFPRGDNSENVKIYWWIFKIFFFWTADPISFKLGTNYSWVMGIQICSNEGPNPLQRGDNHKKAEIGWGHLIIFSRTTGPISFKLKTNHPCMKQIQVYSNEGPWPYPRGDNCENGM